MTRYASEQDIYDIALPSAAVPSSWTGAERVRRVGLALDGASSRIDSYLRKVLEVPLAGSTTEAAGITHSGSGPTITVSGTPDADRSFLLLITLGGAPATAKFNWSLNGGASWEATNVTLALGAYALGTTGLTVTFPDGTYVQWDTYLWTTSGQIACIKRCAAILAAYDILSGRGWDPENGTDAIVAERYRAEIEWLQEVRDGKVEILDLTDETDADGDGEVDELKQGGVVSSRDRIGWGEVNW